MSDSYKHIFLTGNVKTEKYKASSQGGKRKIPNRDRVSHSTKLLNQLDQIWKNKETLHKARTTAHLTIREGTYLSFTSALDHDLVTKSLENIKKDIRLLNIKEEEADTGQLRIKAVVYVPNGMEGFFIKKISDYKNEDLKSGKPKNAPLVNSIEDISLALLEGLWMDEVSLMPGETSKWCEAWLNVNTKDCLEQEQIKEFHETLREIGIGFKNNNIIFPERAVILIDANRAQLLELMFQSDYLAELRIGQEPAGFWVSESSRDQQNWVDDLLNRIDVIDSDVAVCILDSGVNNGHQLLQPLINDSNTLAFDNAWGTNDHERTGHGTLMAGIVGYGYLEQALISSDRIPLTHKICSVKILPPPNHDPTPKELWGDVVSQSISRAEIQNPKTNLIYCMAVTSKEDSKRGRPSSWSGAIDKLSFGEGENQKVILISAGNLEDNGDFENYPNSNFTTTIENPAQSWNALTIGAYTEKIIVTDSDYTDYEALANEGELSPYSSTSLVWEKKWPYKPDIVFEGGNLLKSPANGISRHEDLELLSTSKSFNIKPFATMYATSAATAQASWFAAKIAAEYPDAWPETIRALMVHSSKWNEAMLKQLDIERGKRGDYKKLLQVFGLGTPNLNRALNSRESAMTMIAQEIIQPFAFDDKNRPATNEIHFFDLPWPKDLLLEMGEIQVTLKITLSYYIEPGAGEIGWKDRYRYQSHGLRFDVNNVNESEEEFRKRVNLAARDENEVLTNKSGSNRWEIGVNNRSNGSIHTDFWIGTAAELATCNLIAVYPVIGWWRERNHLNKVENKTRYSLLISLDTPKQDVELYTTVKNMIEIPVEVKT